MLCARATLIATSVLALALTSCAGPGDGNAPQDGDGSQEGLHLNETWIDREARVRTLDRLLRENEQDEVVANFGANTEDLYDLRVLIEDGDGTHRVETEQDAWSHLAADTSRLDSGLRYALIDNEVTWCGEAVDALDFVDDYTREFTDAFDTREEYYSSIDDYVDCGDGHV